MKRVRARRVVVGLMPAILAVGAVSGCSGSAPSVAIPSVTASSSTASGTVPTSTPAPSQPAVPTVASAPASSSASPAKECTATQDGFGSPPALAASTKKATWGKPIDVKPQYEGTAAVIVQAPVASKPSSEDSFGMTPGTQYLLFKVSATYKSGPDVLLSDTDFTLVDAQHNSCDPDSFDTSVPQQDQFQDGTLNNSTKTYSGTIIFDVPDGQNYRKYTLLYVPDSISGANASAAWTG